MEKGHFEKMTEFLQAKRKQIQWRKIMISLSLVVAVITSILMMQPAVTLENNSCEIPEHTHTDECYATPGSDQKTVTICNAETLNIHKHTKECYDEEDNLTCGYADFVVHQHDSNCYDADGNLWCTLPEIETHQHTDSCYKEPQTTSEKAHTHTDECYTTERGELTCKEHVHSDECYTETKNLVCTEEHEHDENCYEMVRELTCGIDSDHQHTDDCYEQAKTLICDQSTEPVAETDEKENEPELICNKTEVILHEHTEECFDEDGNLICGKIQVLEHQHDDACFDKEDELICGMEEHQHSDACQAAESSEEEQAQEETFTLSVQTESGIQVTVSGPVESLPYAPEEITLTANEIASDTAETLRNQALEEEGLTAEKNYLFDVTLWYCDQPIEPLGPVTLSFSGLPSSEAEELKVYHIDEEGEQAADMNAVRDDADNVVLDTDHFSTYSISLLTAATGSYTMTATHKTTEEMYGDSDVSEYLLLAHEGDNYYALGGDGITYPVNIENDNTVQYSGTVDQIKNLCWTMSDKWKDSDNEPHRKMNIRNAKTGKYLYPNNSVLLTDTSTKVNLWFQEYNMAATIYPDEDYWPKIAFGGSKQFHTYPESNPESEAWFFFAKVDSLPYCRVWLDGTDGGLMSLGGAGNTCEEVEKDSPFTLPTSCKAPDKYSYKLKGWYDINSAKYYQPGDKVTITQDTVFYADWGPSTYDIGQSNKNTVQSLNTNAFITTRVFDYGALFNVQSSNAASDISGAGHEEVWSLTNEPAYKQSSLGFVFRDWDTYFKSISYPVGSETWSGESKQPNPNDNNPDIYSELYDPDLIKLLFNPASDIIGKTYVGTGNYLYQYNADTGYYYYDSKLNAASYNQSDSRFYIYNYLERTSDSPKDSKTVERGRDSDFLPFNSPYANTNGKTVQTYTAEGDKSGYQYDAKYDSTEGGITCSSNNAGTNYWFGMSSTIRFYLPDNSASGGTGTLNQSTKGKDMIFKFSGDDDVWVLVDGELVLDIGGLHGVEEGTINFSTGEVWRSIGDGEKTTESFDAGEHALTIYYLERGGSQSNCAIYFNIAPRDYTLELTKTDRGQPDIKLSGAEFTIYKDQGCTSVVDSLRDANGKTINNGTFVSDENGQILCYGLQPNNTYYIKETKAPPGYNGNENVVLKLSIAGIEQSYAITSDLYVDGNLVDIKDKSNIYLKNDTSNAGEERMLAYVFSNQVGYELPNTGGNGTVPYTIGGILLITVAAFLLLNNYTKHKKMI